MIKVLEKAGCTVSYNTSQTCCGQPAFNAGFWDEAKSVCSKFLKDFNGTQASIRAGYSERSAMQPAYDLLRKPEVAELVEARKAELMEKSQMTLEEWVKLVTALAFYDLRKLLDKFGNPIEIPELDELHAMAVAGYEHVEEFEGRGEARLQTGWTRKVKLLDRTPYVRMLGKYLNAFPITK